MDDRIDRYLPLARRIARQSEEECLEGLRSIDPAILKACAEVVRIRLLGDDVEPEDEASK
jgi:hypothetical protein